MHVVNSRVLLRPRDFDASVRFYSDAIGLVRFREWGAPGRRGVVFFLGGGLLELTESAGASGEVGTVRLWLQVADAEAARAELEAKGVAVASPPERKPWGLVEMTVHDPDGLPLVIVEVPDDHPLRKDTR
ncbi:MAG TPA: VOC family protein [Egibacteraceae bacterium]|nr:VOC family protein [Egibacteraceae bacterium]